MSKAEKSPKDLDSNFLTDTALFEAFIAAKDGRATAAQLNSLRKHLWMIYNGNASGLEAVTLDDLVTQGAWDQVTNAPWITWIASPDLPLVEPLRKPRDRTRESIKTAQNRASALVELRNQRQDGAWKELIYVSRYLVAMSLPYEPTKERQIVKSARLGDGSRVHLQLTASIPGVDLPYGSDRTLLHWLLDQIARQLREAKETMGDDPDSLERARFVRWTTASDYLRDMDLDAGSGKNHSDLRGRYRRLSGLSIGLRIEGPDRETLVNIPLIESANLPTSIDVQAETLGQQRLDLDGGDLSFGVLFAKRLVTTMMESAVPFPKEILRRTRKQSQMQDYWLFLAWRSYGAQKSALIPWDEVREQLWHQDQTTRRIKQRFREAIQALHLIWPELQAEAREKGLWIAPPRHGVQLMGEAGSLKRLGGST